jgi:signal transduction histidine kinase
MASDQQEGRPAGSREEPDDLDQAGLTPQYLSTALRRAERQGDEEMKRLLNGIASQHQKETSQLRKETEVATRGEVQARQAETDAVQAMQLKDKAAKAKSMFLANVSHELRTPLNGMIGMSELLKQTEMTPTQSDYVDSIRVCGDTLLQVINDILDFSKMEAGKLRMFNVAFSLREAVPEVIRAVRCTQPPDGLVKTVEQLDLPAQMVYGDNVRLHQIFMNLLSNSYKFTPQGQVTIHGKTDYEDETSITVTCSVEDTGIGISDEQIKRLFRPFSQADE